MDYGLLRKEMSKWLPDFDEIRKSEGYCNPSSCPFRWYWEWGKPSDGVTQPAYLVECKSGEGCEFSYFLEHSEIPVDDFIGDMTALAAFEPHYWMTRIRAGKKARNAGQAGKAEGAQTQG